MSKSTKKLESSPELPINRRLFGSEDESCLDKPAKLSRPRIVTKTNSKNASPNWKFSQKVVKRRNFIALSALQTPKKEDKTQKRKKRQIPTDKNKETSLKTKNSEKDNKNKALVGKNPISQESITPFLYDSPPKKDAAVYESPPSNFQPWTPKSLLKSYSGKMVSRDTPKMKCISPSGKKQKTIPEYEKKQSLISGNGRFSEDLDSYSIIDLIGRGSFFEVYKVRNLKSKKLFALKKSKNKIASERVYQRYLGEVSVLKKIGSHKNILKIHAAWLELSEVFFLTPLLDFTLKDWPGGSSVRVELFENENLEKGVWKCLHDISNALSHIHSKGYVHVDLKPDNILIYRPQVVNGKRFGKKLPKEALTPDLQLDRFLIADFGQARKAGEKDALQMCSNALGEWRYRPPEVLRVTASLRHDDEDPMSVSKNYDIYSLGMVTLDILLGTILPYEALEMIRAGETKQFLQDAKWSETLKSLVMEMLSPNPIKRPTATKLKKICSKMI